MAGPALRRISANERDPLIDAEYGATGDSNDARDYVPRESGSSRKLVTAVAALLALGVGIGGTLAVLQMLDKLPRGDTGAVPIPVPPPSPIEVPAGNKDGKGKKRRNVIMMVSDGFGATSETFGRTMYHVLGLDKNATRGATVYGSSSGAPGDWWGPKTPLDDILVGQSRTKSSSSWVTDSAAGATAFSCASKSYNGAIGVTADGAPCGTAFEAAKLKGYKTGLIVTSRITHATPASFNSHVLWRDYENDIAEQQIGDLPLLGRTADLQFGGGRRHFVPQGHPESVREDTRDLLAEAASRGVTVATTRAEFDAIRAAGPKGAARKLPIVGLFSPDHMPYNIDRDPAVQPSLEEMADTGLRVLRAASHDDDESPGFFALVEGSRIDMAGHSNDPATHAHEILHYYRVIAAVRKFVDECNAAGEETIMVSTSDHETGGLALARQVSAKYPEYQWYPEVLLKQKQSTVALANELIARRASSPDMSATILTLAAERLGVTDLSKVELAFLADPLRTSTELDYALGTVVSMRAQLGWSTHGHSGADVNLYAHGHGADKLRGSWENTDVGMFLQHYIGVERDVPLITAALRKQLKYKHPAIPPPKDGPGLMASGVKGGSEAAARVEAYGHD